jgi:4-amino-4-deoxy-L-arabinose transferase-like glycosyltransferase
MFLFFSAAQTKLAGYILPVIPAGVIIITLFWSQELKRSHQEGKKPWPFIISVIINGIIFIILALVSAISPQLVGGDPSAPNFERALRESGLHLALTSICGLAGLAVFVLLFKRKYWRWLWVPNLLAFLGFMTFITPFLIPLFDSQKQQEFRELSQIVPGVIEPQEELFLMGYPRYSLVYYSQHQVRFLDNVELVRNYLQGQEQKRTVLMLTSAKYIDKFGLLPQDYQLIEQRGIYQLIRVPKDKLLPQN